MGVPLEMVDEPVEHPWTLVGVPVVAEVPARSSRTHDQTVDQEPQRLVTVAMQPQVQDAPEPLRVPTEHVQLQDVVDPTPRGSLGGGGVGLA